jgi:glycosyltransferase involved in cell wall biosynthesis
MRVAFYAPLKAPTSAVPSGDRQMARALIAALAACGHEVELASTFRSRDGAGDPARQRRVARLGGRLAERLVRRYRGLAPARRPAAWFTYHLYHKAPDWLGPPVADALRIPYLVAEASFAPKQEGGRWALGHAAARRAIRRADAIIGLNSHDARCVAPLLADPRRLHAFRPFADTAPFAAAAEERAAHRAWLTRALALDPGAAILLAVAMMRPGDKLASYRLLGRALSRVADGPWQLVVVGDGPARAEARAALAPLGAARLRFAGERPPGDLPRFYAAADICVWPGVNEAYGVSLLEAQAAGLPVIAGRNGGIGDIVRDDETGRLVPVGDEAAFGDAVAQLLRAPEVRARFSAAALRTAARDHSLAAAARRLDRLLADVVAGVAA